jgi:hypothetical protein
MIARYLSNAVCTADLFSLTRSASFEVALFDNAVAFLTPQNLQLERLNRTLTRGG